MARESTGSDKGAVTRLRTSSLLLALGVLSVVATSAATAAICVPATADGWGLQGCLNRAVAGDKIVLPAGVYRPVLDPVFNPAPADPRTKTFVIFKSITIESHEGAILSGDLLGDDVGGSNVGDNAYNVLVVFQALLGQNLDVTLRGVTVRGGNSADGGFFVGGGVLITSSDASAAVSFDGVTVEENQAVQGGGVFVNGFCSASIGDSDFVGNRASQSGGAVKGLFAFVEIDRSSFRDNTASFTGGAVDLLESFGYSIRKSEFTGNTADSGGAVHAWVNSDIEAYQGGILDSVFSDNHAAELGGSLWLQEGAHTVADSAFNSNTAGGSGGAIFLQGQLPGGGAGVNDPGFYSLENNHFTENSAVGGGGGAVLAVSVGELTLSANHYVRNSAGTWAGAVGVGLPEVVATNIGETLDENFAVRSHKEHYLANRSDGLAEFPDLGGGALSIVRSTGSVDRAHFTRNEAGFGADTLDVEDSSGLSFGRLRFANEGADDCDIEGSGVCP